MLPQRKQIRLLHFDYALTGAYFITCCSYEKRCFFSSVSDGIVQLTPLGKIIEEELIQTPIIRPSITLDQFIIMPNHIHAIVLITDGKGTHQITDSEQSARTFGGGSRNSLSSMLSQTKSKITKRAKTELNWDGEVWQRGFYEHIIRDENDMGRIRDYIITNPLNWETDQEHPNINPP